MEDFIKRQIDMIGLLMLGLAEKLGLASTEVKIMSMDSVRAEVQKSGVEFDIDGILAKEHPVAFMVETLNLSNEGLEAFAQVMLHTDIDPEIQQKVLDDTIAYLDSQGYYSFTLHSFL